MILTLAFFEAKFQNICIQGTVWLNTIPPLANAQMRLPNSDDLEAMGGGVHSTIYLK